MALSNIKSFVDRCLPALSIAGLCALAFIGGAVGAHYNFFVSRPVVEAFEAEKTWRASLKPAQKKTGRAKQRKPAAPRDDAAAADARTIDGTVVAWDKKLAHGGYTLLSYRFSTRVQLIDMAGNVAHTWNMPFRKAWPDPSHVHSRVRARIFIETAHVFPNGDLLAQYCGIGDTPYGYGLVKMDKDSNVLWTYSQNAHHDFHVDEEGNIYALTHEMLKDPVRGLESLNYPMLADYVVKLSPEGKELDRISILEAFHGSPFEPMLYLPRISNRPVKWDQFHTNTVMKLEPAIAGKFPQFKAGHILISLRSMGAVAVIDPVSRKVVWAYRGQWRFQHAARFLPNGHLMVLDNLGYATQNGNGAKIVEFDPKTLETSWSFTSTAELPLNSNAYGRLQRLSNGNTLIASALNRRVIEVTPDGKIAWNYGLLLGKQRKRTPAIVTAKRYEEDALPFLKP